MLRRPWIFALVVAALIFFLFFWLMPSLSRLVSSKRHWSVEVYVSQGPHQGETVVFGYIEGSFLVSRTGDARERYAPNIYRCIRT